MNFARSVRIIPNTIRAQQGDFQDSFPFGRLDEAIICREKNLGKMDVS